MEHFDTCSNSAQILPACILYSVVFKNHSTETLCLRVGVSRSEKHVILFRFRVPVRRDWYSRSKMLSRENLEMLVVRDFNIDFTNGCTNTIVEQFRPFIRTEVLTCTLRVHPAE